MRNFIFYLAAVVISFNFLQAEAPLKTLDGEEIDPFVKRTLEYARGHATFKSLFFKENEKEFVRLVKEGQSPKTLFIGCSDSRVIPELIASSNPGELFVIRTAGNFVPKYDKDIAWDGVAATIYYGVEALGISNIIICGHSHCGAINGLFNIPEETSYPQAILSKWLKWGAPAKQLTLESLGKNITPSERDNVAEHLSILFQIENLLSYPFIKKKVDEQKLFLHGWYFNIEKGEIEYYDLKEDRFRPLNSLLMHEAFKAA